MDSRLRANDMAIGTRYSPAPNSITTQSRTSVLTWMALQTRLLSGFYLLRAASGCGASPTLRCNNSPFYFWFFHKYDLRKRGNCFNPKPMAFGRAEPNNLIFYFFALQREKMKEKESEFHAAAGEKPQPKSYINVLA